jgi:hypothetical protein
MVNFAKDPYIYIKVKTMETNQKTSNEKYINTIAQYTGSRAIAVRNFINANNLDPIKLAADLSLDQKTERKNFASAVSGKARAEYLEQLKTKYTLNENENREPLTFWQTKYGKIILQMNKYEFDKLIVKQYLNGLIGNGDPHCKLILNRIALDLNINPNEFESFYHQIEAMVERMNDEYEIYQENMPLTKGKINEVIDKVLGMHFDREIQRTGKPKRFKITLTQLQLLIPRIISNKRAKTEIQNAAK